MGRGSSKAGAKGGSNTGRNIEELKRNTINQLYDYMSLHDGELPKQVILPDLESREAYFSAVNEVYTLTGNEKKALDFTYIEDGKLHIPYGGYPKDVTGLSADAIEGLKKLEVYRVVNSSAIPDVKYWRKRK